MCWQVYYHVNIRCFESMLVAWNKRVMMVETTDRLVMDYHHLIQNPTDLSSYLMADDATLISLFKILKDHDDPIIRDLSNRLLNRNLFHEIS